MDLPRLRRLLGGPETAWLLERARDRMAALRPLDTPATLKAATPAQRRAVELLLGRRLRAGTSLTVPLAEVDRVLRESLACPDGLAAAVVALTGPVTDKRAQDAALAAAWQQALAELDHPAVTDRPELVPWRAKVESTGLLKRLSQADPTTARRLAADTVRVLSALPADGLTLPVLAARTLGDAHALDDGRPLAAVVLSAVRALAALPAEATTGAEGRRAAWATVGVALDELSSRVLVLGLPGSPRTTPGRVLAAAHEDGEPCLLTLRQLTRQPADLGLAGRTVRVCENPAVLAAAADELGPHCPPLVCVEGNLSAAARTLLRHLSDQDCPIAYHGDFDWGGFRIATSVLRLPTATPWRYDTPSYLTAVERGLGAPLTTGSPIPTPWDPALSTAMARHGIRVEEEHLIDRLLADLRQS
ncbi:TIGR02679 family protein [Streptantibioticus ferralitis]|uniref:TIGR02679 family protein n=1 Tax=Streptantibioticus ferralitis TaxID=236510 RepID=A0ABT5YUD1_9ACTN|nr:TIGR02679 family protein [Streptantibioticus ferralitis]MDF2254415.1 TIGR02679 family protein [Streptantibioticus ferralitis]